MKAGGYAKVGATEEGGGDDLDVEALKRQLDLELEASAKQGLSWRKVVLCNALLVAALLGVCLYVHGVGESASNEVNADGHKVRDGFAETVHQVDEGEVPDFWKEEEEEEEEEEKNEYGVEEPQIGQEGESHEEEHQDTSVEDVLNKIDNAPKLTDLPDVPALPELYKRARTSTEPPLDVCVLGNEARSHELSIFLLQYLERWGGEMHFKLWSHYTFKRMPHLVETGYIDADRFSDDLVDEPSSQNPVPKSCPLVNMISPGTGRVNNNSFKREAANFVVADEECHFKDKVTSKRRPIDFRNYFSSSNKMLQQGLTSWVPLGPRYEWKPVDADELMPMSHRTIPYNFQGSLTSTSRSKLKELLNQKKLKRQYPWIRNGVLKTHSDWSKLITFSSYNAPAIYRKVLMHSIFTFVPAGVSPEAFRLFEVIDAGSIPVFSEDHAYQSSPCNDAFDPMYKANIPMLTGKKWEKILPMMDKLLNNPAELKRMQCDLIRWRGEFWNNVTQNVECNVAKIYVRENAQAVPADFDLDRFCRERPMQPFPSDYYRHRFGCT